MGIALLEFRMKGFASYIGPRKAFVAERANSFQEAEMRMGKSDQRTIILATALLPLLGSIGFANTVTWDGGSGGTGTSWNVGADWNPDGVPASGDVAQFDATGLTANKIISLDASQAINTLTINNTTVFTIGASTDTSSGFKLTLATVNRNDVSGTEGIQTIVAGVTLSANSQWTVAGSNYLASTGGISGTGFSLEKLGAGELRIGTNSYTGGTTVTAGTLRATATGAVLGNLTIGGGASSASFVSNVSGDVVANTTNVTVKANGTMSMANGDHIKNLVIEGGTFNNNFAYVDGSITMTGGTLGGSGTLQLNSGAAVSVTTLASASTALISVNNNTSNSLSYTVADGTAIYDLKMTGSIVTGNTSATVTKTGSGVMALTNSSTTASPFNITGGTLLVNNTTGSGTGQSAVTVSTGATLGGIGFIGGNDGTNTNANANVTATGAGATIAPGNINEVTGAHVLGTLTVGNATQNNNVTFGNNSRLYVQLGSASASDKLAVVGNLVLTSTSDTLYLATASGAVLSPNYVLATFTGTMSGRFNSVLLDGLALPSLYTLEYRDSLGAAVLGGSDITNGSIVLTPEPVSMSFIVLAGAGLLARRRRMGVSSVRHG